MCIGVITWDEHWNKVVTGHDFKDNQAHFEELMATEKKLFGGRTVWEIVVDRFYVSCVACVACVICCVRGCRLSLTGNLLLHIMCCVSCVVVVVAGGFCC